MNLHSLKAQEIYNLFQTSQNGLTSQKAQDILKKVGPNSLPKGKKRHLYEMIWEQLKSTLVIILIVAALLSWFLEESLVDTVVILVIVIINTAIGVMQEYKTEQTLEHLKNLLTPQARVLRDGSMQLISSIGVVPGDILLLDEGEKIVADARMMTSSGLRVNQSILTGESVAQEKGTDTIGEHVPMSDRTNMVYQGTSVAAGSGRAIVVATGANTELGHISGMVSQIREDLNPFSQKLEEFTRKIAIFIGILCMIIIGVLLFEGAQFSHSLLVSVSLAVSAIPEGLPAVVALSLALATKRLVKKNVLVHKLPSSETLGRVTVICTDKTGTLTRSEMQVVDIFTEGKYLEQSAIKKQELNWECHKGISIFDIATLCNKAGYGKDATGIEKMYGDPTEIGLLDCALKYGYKKEALESLYPAVHEYPFDSERKRMSTVCAWSDNHLVSLVKGAPERILELISQEQTQLGISALTDARRHELYEVLKTLAGQGKRVLAFAYKPLESHEYNQEYCESDLIFVGFMAMMDPARPEVASAIDTCQSAGIRVIMITGDSGLTASFIGQSIGLTGETLDATKLCDLTDDELNEKLKTVSIFSRIAPQDKLRIVRILRSQGHIVAMTGDGVNDALALKQSDIGIAMGIRGTDVARDASDMVLLDDNFASIVSGVQEGRRIYDNTKKFIKYLLACNFYEVILVAACVLYFRDPLIVPFAALHILWINLVTDSLPALALSTQEGDEDVMKRKPTNTSLLSGLYSNIIISGVLGFIIVGASFLIFYNQGIMIAQTVAVTTSILFQMTRALGSARNQPFNLRCNRWLVGAVLISLGLHFGLLISPWHYIFDFASFGQITPDMWTLIIGLPIIGYIVGESAEWGIEKLAKK